MAFTFKQFHIDDNGCGMPVSTDGVILGAWANLANAQSVLDIGAGSGLLTLMVAQRSNVNITAVEIDKLAYKACKANVNTSLWASRIQIHHQSIADFCKASEALFDHIICNPPYFDCGPLSATNQRALARHTVTLSFELLLESIFRLLTDNGIASLILPIQSMERFLNALRHQKLIISRQQMIISVEEKQPHRILLQLQKCHSMQLEAVNTSNALSTLTNGKTNNLEFNSTLDNMKPLVIRNRNNSYTNEMINLTRDFYLNMV